MAINSTGRRVLVNKGIYDSTLQYYPMDAVYYEESYYICIKACVGIDPTDTNYWGYSHSLGDISVSLGIRLSDGILYITDTVTTEDLGKVSILYRGEYSSTEMYAPLDVVTYEGSSYICIKDTTSNLPTDPTYFGLLCEGMEGRGITSVTLVGNKHLVVNYTDGTSTDIGEVVINTPLDQIDAASINSDGHLILSRDDGTTLDAGYVVGPTGPTGPRGKKGDPFRYEDFTPEQLEGLRGPAFTYNDFTYDQLEALRGPKGEDAPKESVLFVPQTLTSEQQSQARTNIGVASKKETDTYKERLISVENDIAALKNFTPQPFEVSGDIARVDVFQDAPLNVVTHIELIQAGSGDPYPAGGGKQLYDITSRTTTGETVDDEDWISVTLDNTVGTSTTYKTVYTPASSALKVSTVYNIITEIATLTTTTSESGYIQVTGSVETSNKGQFVEAVSYATTGTKVIKNTTRSDFSGCITMLRTVVAAPAGAKVVAKFRISVLEDTTITESNFIYQPYSNIRPISGRTSAKLTRCGKNFISAPKNVDFKNATYIYDAPSGTLTLTKGAESVWGQIGYMLEMDAAKFVGRKLTLSCVDASTTYTGDEPRIYVMWQNKNITINKMILNPGANSLMFTVPEGVTALYFIIRIDQNKTAPEGTVLTVRGLQLEVGDAATTFEPYQSNTYAADFGQTVYGGTLDWQTGVLTVDKAMLTLTGSEVWSASSSNSNTYYINQQNNPTLIPNVYNGDFFNEYFHTCSHYKAGVYSTSLINNICCIYAGSSGKIIAFKDDRFATVNEWKTFVTAQYAAGTPVQVCYKLATPTTIQLTPQKITALQGINNIWSDAGRTTVSGRKDIIWLTHSLLERIAAVESAISGL